MSLKIEAMEARVGPETETTSFPETFWQRQDVMINALDNIQVNPKPYHHKTLNPKPYHHKTLNPKPYHHKTLNPKS